MAKRKADALAQAQLKSNSKKAKHEKDAAVAKRDLLEDSDSSSSSEDESVGGVQLDSPQFKINQEYANRFEHNKKREELHRLEEKFRHDAKPTNGKLYGDKYDEDSESSEDEDEDDEGFLATEDLDAEISATLQAIKNKDPRVYDEKVTFYKPIEETEEEAREAVKKDKPMYLSDYHRENLLKGYTGEDEDPAPKTYVQEQDDLKRSIVKEMHAAAAAEDSSGSQDEDGGFLVPKSQPKPSAEEASASKASKVKVAVDVSTADKEPDTFLSNFMQARAWVPSDGARFQPLESDDDEEDELADKFETAYNLRFEDPTGSNEMLKSYARDIVAAKSVRREEPNNRKKQRDAEREKKETAKREREVEKARLRQLKIGEMEEKLQKIKKAAGIKGKTLQGQEWTKFLDENWDDDKWEEEMNRRFGDEYYAEQENGSDEDTDGQAETGSNKKKIRKPKWDDDIDIKDLIPEFEGSQGKPNFTLSDSDEQGEGLDDNEGNNATVKKKKTKKDREQEKQAKKKAARLERKKIEELVDSRIDLDLSLKSKQPSLFRYRETSPISFGLTARDILMAPDASLNEFAGLKKMAAFRDSDKKRKDKKHLGKKARLRKWRRETFGNEDGPEIVAALNTGDVTIDGDNVNIVEGKKKKKRSRKNKRVGAAA